ncbi:protein-disulfide reductase DsbD family protein [Frateuria terrea]|uniref:Thiol:disulfide interchange protein DsbD n=1 Tax=Frateuria terrea TaxID=529704 RepID=A0A1H6WX47_9GAMM|nr:protein-disulfide reductase DsbD [Frateuria terrea]SEJ17052.1 thiol:disulfide interchange protein DsbD [Frateuria terrea]SFP56175.1 thiol:disulfide interchange protein DsbD [Frateuria terrea]
MCPITGRLAARLPFLMLVLLCLAALAQPLCAQEDDGLLPVTAAYRLSADASTPGVLKLHWEIAPDYYLYRGRMKFKPAEGVTLGEAAFPDGERHHDEYLGDVEIYHHAIDASVPYTVAPGTTRLRLGVQFQGCHEVDPKICYPPHTEQLDLPLPPTGTVGARPGSLGAALQQLGSSSRTGGSDVPLPAEQAFRLDALAQDPHHLLLRWTMPPGYYLYRDQTKLHLRDGRGLTLTPRWPAGTRKDDPHFGSVTVYFNELDLPVAVGGDLAGRTRLTLETSFQGCEDGGLCYPVMTRALDVDLANATPATGTPAMAAPEAPPVSAQGPLQTSLWAALLLALGGGLVLNLMPCVLPVLSIKAVGLLESGESPARARAHALAYTAGVLASFVALGLGILALRSAGHALGWGTQLQQPLLVGGLALVMLAVGLSMSGLVQFGASLGNTGAGLAARGGAAGDFFTGVLAVVVASPCTAPFMGSALAYAFAAPAASALMVFVALGLGLALPFLMVGFVPALARRLPRPGRWMETLKQLLAFPMYLSAAWLAWVLANQRGADAIGLLLVSAVFLALTLWWFERSRGRAGLVRAPVLLALLATAVPLYGLAQLPTPVRAAQADTGVVAYSPEKLAELRASGTPVFVDMTADWCVTCKANEHTVLDTAAFRALLLRTGAVYMKGDWTDVNPTIAAFLEQYHSPGVPLYVVFPRGGGAGRKLPTVLTSSLVARALTEAAR